MTLFHLKSAVDYSIYELENIPTLRLLVSRDYVTDLITKMKTGFEEVLPRRSFRYLYLPLKTNKLSFMTEMIISGEITDLTIIMDEIEFTLRTGHFPCLPIVKT
jgi:hypothetical protein